MTCPGGPRTPTPHVAQATLGPTVSLSVSKVGQRFQKRVSNERTPLNHFPLLIKVSLIINICFGSPKSGNTTFRIANTKPILK